MITLQEIEKIIKDCNIVLDNDDYCEQTEFLEEFWDEHTLENVFKRMKDDMCIEDFYINPNYKDLQPPKLEDIELWMETGNRGSVDFFVCELKYNNEIIAAYYCED